MKKVAIIQSNYIPWKGYFDIINDVDLFVFYDSVQYTKHDWRNRNKIKTSLGLQWLTIPIGSQNDKSINEVTIESENWGKKHFNSLCANYSRAPYFKLYKEFLEYVYLEKEWHNLSKINQYLIKTISSEFLGIQTKFTDSSEYIESGNNLERLLNLLKQTNADIYVSGPAAKSYIVDKVFLEANIKLTYKDYTNYPEYQQLYPPFNHFVTIFDVLFNTGPDASYFVWGWRLEHDTI